MRFRYDPEHEDLRESVRAFLTDVASESAVRRDMESDRGWSPRSWSRLCAELELPALAVPEKYGGAGGGLVELGVVLGEAGRSLLCAPLLSTGLAIQALLLTASGDEVAELAAGRRTGTLALREPGRDWDAVPRTRAVPGSNGWRITGTKNWVLDGSSADLFVVSASTPAGTSLFLVESGGGVKAEAIETVDPTRRVARVMFDAAPATLAGADGATLIPSILDTAVILLAAEQVGVAERCLEMATEYARRRIQFGRPIGSFQAVKHKLADVLLEVEAARSAALYAAYAADRGLDVAEAAAIAGATCSDAALLAAGENIQVHGGIGMTWEHPAHLYLKRATVGRMLLRHPHDHLERLLEPAGLPRTAAGERGR
ncbi:alkylation response protein AidB-like acyl-CoA dehydrogenase [Thermocatellispora tengchongensis]|uniref:Alkylation response protein AidB-like acyl-CoA dehydrogenase n=1 Tax=Thermocatellispora tengchongensis TaxID=1073253 RepID=A0A840PFR5_9ACTN|nr:acyl-CoA dehydrogenase family protein [Thermocatellispora tengchongensis]MBB5138418.1 alkylation response protein AidB-like acyl-CoA dehydrogenase [Thermocatellispora tengchongensis]